MYQKNETSYKDKVELYSLIIQNDDSETTLLLYNQSVQEVEEEYRKQKTRIIGEGIFFFALLAFGIVRLFQFFKKEIEVAGQQSNFLLSITHELKSPLASAMLNIQTLLKRRALPDEKVDQLLNNSQEELSRLRSLVERLLLAAKMEEQDVVHDVQEINLSETYGNIFTQYKNRDKQQHQLNQTIQPNLRVQGDKILLETVLVNLLDNAFKYCDENGQIDLSIKAQDKWVVVELSNDGQNISDLEKRKIWQKFYRIGDENTRSSKGTGLGLYIVKQIVVAHQGKISVADKKPSGVVFKIMLPAIMTLK